MISTEPTVEYVKPAVFNGKWSNAGEALCREEFQTLRCDFHLI